MRAPRPVVVIVVLMAWALFGVSRAISEGEIRPTPGGIGYLVGTLLAPVLLAVLYVWWYRRRYRT